MTAPLPLAIVVAVAENGVIGRDNALPWRLKTDLARFKRLTMGKPMIMGRRSWDAVGRPLPGRRSIVLTRDRSFAAPGAEVARDWAGALRLGHEAAAAMDAEEVIVFGGAEIYRLALPEVETIRLTCVHASVPGDVRFPDFDRSAFREISREEHPAGPDDDHPFAYVDLVRIPAAD